MTEIGKKLKEAREAKGLTLDQLQEITKIQKRYLEAVENGNHKVLPGDFYVRAFTKQYAEAVELNYEELIGEGEQQTTPPPEKNVSEEKSVTPSRKNKEKNVEVSLSSTSFKDYLPRILVVTAIIAVLMTIWFVMQQGGPSSNVGSNEGKAQENTVNDAKSDEPEDSPLNSENETEDQEQENNEPEEVEESEETAPSQQLVVEETSGNRSTLTLSNNDAFVLTLTAQEGGKSYVRVRNNEGNVFFEGILESGQTETIDVSAEDVIEMNIGNSTGLTVKINDEEMEYPIDPTERVHQVITIKHEGVTQ